MGIVNTALSAFLVSVFLAYITTPLVIIFAKRIGVIDDPQKSTHPKVIHTYPVPRGGGLAVFLSIFATSLLFIPVDKHLMGILLGALVLVVLGLLDDKYDLSPSGRLVIQFVAAGLPIAAGIGIAFVNLPWIGFLDLSFPRIPIEVFGQTKYIWLLSDMFALVWIVTLMNFLNMGAKGVDGQLPGVAGVAALAIAAISLEYSADITQWPVIILALITAGAFLGFLPWNTYPQKIMPSFSGSNLAGYLLGVLAILSTAKVGTLTVVVGLPLIDTGYTVVRRIVAGKSPLWGDTGHLHHRLLKIGWSKKRVSQFYWLITAILGLTAVNLKAVNKLYTIVGLGVFVGGLILWLTHQSKSSK